MVSRSSQKCAVAVDERIIVFDPAPSASTAGRHIPVHGNKRAKSIPYTFDWVFDESATQIEVYEHTVRPLLDGVLDGYNATVFAYGATGSGKTHTISGTQDHPGILPLTMAELFERIKDIEREKTVDISVSYLEVYNETIRDLLQTGNDGLDIREDADRIVVPDLSEHYPTCGEEVMALLEQGSVNRTKSPTQANEHSSRSHAIFQINIRQTDRIGSQDVQVATLTLCDLAGSERASVTENKGMQLREGANINRSLLALGNCINALCVGKGHIPYRDSKLTRLLKYSLGGNCRTLMIANISAAWQHYEETHNTLKYADRAKEIRLKVERNVLKADMQLEKYVETIQELQREVEALRAQIGKEAALLPQDEDAFTIVKQSLEDLYDMVHTMGKQKVDLEVQMMLSSEMELQQQLDKVQSEMESHFQLIHRNVTMLTDVSLKRTLSCFWMPMKLAQFEKECEMHRSRLLCDALMREQKEKQVKSTNLPQPVVPQSQENDTPLPHVVPALPQMVNRVKKTARRESMLPQLSKTRRMSMLPRPHRRFSTITALETLQEDSKLDEDGLEKENQPARPTKRQRGLNK
jgi:hypothetical protein